MTQLAVLDRYQRRFGQQEPRDQRPIKFVRDHSVESIHEVYKKWLNTTSYGSEDLFPNAVELIGKSKYTTNQIKEFTKMLRVYEEKKEDEYKWTFSWTGMFLQALISTSDDQDFEIFTEDLEEGLNFVVGQKNKKNVTVIGDVGDWTGSCMEGGTVLIKGNARGYVGSNMRNGLIVIEGNAGWAVGYEMIGGEVIVKGNSGSGIGISLAGGIIKIEGKIGELNRLLTGEMPRGQIYHRGVLVRGKE